MRLVAQCRWSKRLDGLTQRYPSHAILFTGRKTGRGTGGLVGAYCGGDGRRLVRFGIDGLGGIAAILVLLPALLLARMLAKPVALLIRAPGSVSAFGVVISASPSATNAAISG
jgi:hypothetical protein